MRTSLPGAGRASPHSPERKPIINHLTCLDGTTLETSTVPEPAARTPRPAARQTVTGERLTGERALFGAQHVDVTDSVFTDGESPLKQSRDVTITGSLFGWKYPLWYAKDVSVSDSTLLNTARAGIWYSRDISITNTTIDAPKTFRRSSGITLDKVQLPRADETLWNCDGVTLDHVTAKGAYFAMGSSNITARDFRLTGDYAFDGVRNVEITDATIVSKDAFWNSENVTVRDSFIVGEYLGWNSRNLTFINCTIQSLQGLCYVDNLVMRDCRLLDTERAFEYSTVDAEITTRIGSVVNPTSGVIRCEGIDELILDKALVDPTKTTIITPMSGTQSAVECVRAI